MVIIIFELFAIFLLIVAVLLIARRQAYSQLRALTILADNFLQSYLRLAGLEINGINIPTRPANRSSTFSEFTFAGTS